MDFLSGRNPNETLVFTYNKEAFMVCHLPDKNNADAKIVKVRMLYTPCLLYTSPSPRDA